MKAKLSVMAAMTLTLLSGCGTYPTAGNAMFDPGSALQGRSYQTRVFDTADREKTLRAVVATLQDLGFAIEKADAVLGIVSATKFSVVRVNATASVRPRGAKQMAVRLNAQYSSIQVPGAAWALEDASAYQDFFLALSKTMFLAAQELD